MPTYPLPPGAWLSGAGLSGPQLNPPVDVAGSALNPPVGLASLNPPVGLAQLNPPVGLATLNPPVGLGSLNPPVGLGSLNPPVGLGPLNPPVGLDSLALAVQLLRGQPAAVRGTPGNPWTGVDPGWVYAGGQPTLLAQALRKTRSRIAPADDPRRTPAQRGSIGGAGRIDTLFRWDRPYRVKAVVTQLVSRIVVEGLAVWWVPAPVVGARSTSLPKPTPLFELAPPGRGFDYSLQIDKVLRAATEREDRMPEILTQAGDIGVFFDALTGIDSPRAPCLAELLEVAGEVSTHVVMAIKHQVGEWRPVQRSGLVVPVIQTPGHGSLPSGHAMMSALTSELLAHLLYPAQPGRRLQLDALARRIAFNRVVAGVHFPMDSHAGYALGRQLAAVLIAAASHGRLPDPLPHPVTEDSELVERLAPADQQAAMKAMKPQAAAPSAKAARAAAGAAAKACTAPLWMLIWDAAQRDVRRLRV